MKKCLKCGTQYEGNVCPNCGSVGEGRKRCPHCGAIIASASKFCNGCGYSFENNSVPAPTNPAPAKQQSAAVVWAKKHKVAIIISSIVLVVAIVLLSLIPTFIKASVNGTYYAYNAREDKLDAESYITLNTGKWSDSEGLGGTYKVKGKTVTLIVDMFGEKVEFASATVDNGMLSYEIMGEKTVYLSRKHKHSYGGWKDKDEQTCTQDKTHSRFCGCGKEEVEVVTTASGHQGNWTTTKKATCTEYGEQETHCYVCKQDVVRFIEPLGHNMTFVVDTKTHYEMCTRCKDVALQTETENHDDLTDCSKCGYPFIYELVDGEDKHYKITGIYDCAAKDEVRILSKHNNIAVTEISNNAFYKCTSITYIYIPDSITKIDSYAFACCSELTNIAIPNSVTSIGIGILSDCNKIRSIFVPFIGKTLNANNPYEFECLGYIFGAKIGNSVNEYHSNYVPKSLEWVVLTNGVKYIDSYTFWHCSEICTINIPNSVENIYGSPFYDCGKLTLIRFDGTKAQWKEIQKSEDWNRNTGDFTIQCTDGKLDKDGNEID